MFKQNYIVRNKYLKIRFIENGEILLIERFTVKNDTSYRKMIKKVSEVFKKVRPVKVLVDNSKFFYPIDPKLQEWSESILTPLSISLGIEKIVYIESENFFANVALGQIISDAALLGLKIDFKKTYEEALEWLKKEPD